MWGTTLDDLKGPQVKRARRLLNSKPGMPPSIALCVGALAIFFLGWSPTRVWSAEVEVTPHETDKPGTAQTAPDTNPNASAGLANVTPEGELLGPPIIPFYFNPLLVYLKYIFDKFRDIRISSLFWSCGTLS